MADYRVIILLFFVGYALVEVFYGRFGFRRQTAAKDALLDVGSVAGLGIFVVPSIMVGSAWVTEGLFPGSEGALRDWSFWQMFAALIIADDLVQYWWHRLSHTWPKLFLFHRAHHSAEYLSVRVVYRNNLFYYLFMPGLWLSGILLYLGCAPAYYVYYIAKMVVIIGAHSSVRWDEKLLRKRWLRPLMWVVVRTFSTPTTHAAHHGKYKRDRATHYQGNYGNFLFVWDIVFGTAKINDRVPKHFGIERTPPATWVQELLWPFRLKL